MLNLSAFFAVSSLSWVVGKGAQSRCRSEHGVGTTLETPLAFLRVHH